MKGVDCSSVPSLKRIVMNYLPSAIKWLIQKVGMRKKRSEKLLIRCGRESITFKMENTPIWTSPNHVSTKINKFHSLRNKRERLQNFFRRSYADTYLFLLLQYWCWFHFFCSTRHSSCRQFFSVFLLIEMKTTSNFIDLDLCFMHAWMYVARYQHCVSTRRGLFPSLHI